MNELPYVIDEPDKQGDRELRLEGGIVGWIKMDEWPGAQKWVEELLDHLNFIAQGGMESLYETKAWAETHHRKCEDICGAECVPSEDEVKRFQESNHQTWEEE
tara:strand:- start:2014 stop:2322 length:309 start_codon:yes stop_codon:yes gene_type:complete